MHIRSVALLCSLLAMPLLLPAQATPAATTPGDLQVGLGYSRGNPDYGTKSLNGFTVYGDADIWRHFGAEAEFHRISGDSPTITESTYEVGARYRLPLQRFSPYLKILVGGGDFTLAGSTQNGTYSMYAGGGGIDYRLSRHFVLRADYEYQRWGNFPPRGLQPNLVTLGAAYRFR